MRETCCISKNNSTFAAYIFGNITITGGEVTATATSNAAGIMKMRLLLNNWPKV